MKPNTNQRRSRGRSGTGNSGGGGNSGRRGGRNQNYESNGPEVKVRGSAQQVLDKYLQLARDAQSSGDRVKAEGYLQYAEHYYRIVNEAQENAAAKTSAAQGNEQAAPRPVEQAAEASSDKDKPRAPRPPRAPRRPRRNDNTGGDTSGGDKAASDTAAPVKNEATLAAEAASANAGKEEATVESTVPASAPNDDAEDAANVGE